jgi:hypothetical protein
MLVQYYTTDIPNARLLWKRPLEFGIFRLTIDIIDFS